MRALMVFMGIFVLLTASGPALSADLESLAREGYKVVEETRIFGQFKGCDARTTLTFTNGKAFVCSTYAYSFAVYMPAVYILKNKAGDIKVLINGNVYSGSFLEPGK